MNSIAYEEYINKIESSISYNRQQFFPMDKKLRRERILKLAKKIGIALSSFDKVDIKDFIRSYYGRIVIKHSLDTIGVVVNAKDWSDAARAGVKQGSEWWESK